MAFPRVVCLVMFFVFFLRIPLHLPILGEGAGDLNPGHLGSKCRCLVLRRCLSVCCFDPRHRYSHALVALVDVFFFLRMGFVLAL